MTNRYCEMMQRQSLSQQAKEAICDRLRGNEERKTRPMLVRAAIVAACLAVMIPVTAYAAESIFGVSIVQIIRGDTPAGKPGTGYRVDHPGLTGRPLTDFPEEIQKMEDYRLVAYESWQDAEAELGITLVNNPVLFQEQVTKEHSFRLEENRVFQRAHCYATYNGLDGQFYRATLRAAYRYAHMHITLSSTVTCQHPAISKEEEESMHYHGVMYRDQDVENISQEQYLAENGIQATLVTVDRVGGKTTDYEATFSAGGASYRITIHSNDKSRDGEVKRVLVEILEGFVF